MEVNSKPRYYHSQDQDSWDNIEEIEPDEFDLTMLREIENDPDCHEFISAEEAMRNSKFNLSQKIPINSKNDPRHRRGHHLDNIIYLPGSRTGGKLSRSESCERRRCFMSTYEELQLIVSVALLIVAILTYTHKK